GNHDGKAFARTAPPAASRTSATRGRKLMVIRYSERPVLIYGQQTTTDSWRDRFPGNAQPIATAPERGSTPVRVYEPSGESHWALHYQGRWIKVEGRRDPYSGTTNVTMTGEQVANPVMWSS